MCGSHAPIQKILWPICVIFDNTDGCRNIHFTDRVILPSGHGLHGLQRPTWLPSLPATILWLATDFEFLLAACLHIPYGQVSLLQNDIGIVQIVIGCSPQILNDCSASRVAPNCCELCCSRLSDGRSWGLPLAFDLEEGAFGTGEWGIKFGDPEILNKAAWSGRNVFCSFCWHLQAFIAAHLPEDSPRLLGLLQAHVGLSKYLQHLEHMWFLVDESEGRALVL